MKSLIAFTLLLIVSQASADSLPWSVRVIHDDARGVTCWHYVGVNQGGISCLPDSQLQQRDAKTAEQDGPTPTTNPTPRGHEERFQL